jgi:hypothetical protein
LVLHAYYSGLVSGTAVKTERFQSADGNNKPPVRSAEFTPAYLGSWDIEVINIASLRALPPFKSSRVIPFRFAGDEFKIYFSVVGIVF